MKEVRCEKKWAFHGSMFLQCGDTGSSGAGRICNKSLSECAVNDIFIGPKSHTSARYCLTLGNETENQSSSGIIVSTGFGSTGWLQSILAGALGVTGSKSHVLQQGFAWDEKRLQFTVREPFPTKTTSTKLVFGSITEKTQMHLESFMPENGVIFSDGIERDYLPFNSGCVVSIGISKTKGLLVVG